MKTNVKCTKIMKRELWNLYIIQNKKLSFEEFQFFEKSPQIQTFSKFRKHFGVFDVFVKGIIFFNIVFGFSVFNSIW